MIYNWYKIFNLTEFMATGLVSRTYQYYLEDIALKDILVTRGNLVSITVDGVLLSIDLLGHNPFEFEGVAVYKDANNDIYYGVQVEN